MQTSLYLILCLGLGRIIINFPGLPLNLNFAFQTPRNTTKVKLEMDSASLFNVKVRSGTFVQPVTTTNLSPQDKVVLVTGGAKGIGRMISEGFVANGAKVYISSRDAKACEQACKELNALGTNSPSLRVYLIQNRS